MAAVEQGGYGNREIFIRTNGLNTPWGYEDLVAAAGVRPHAVLLPKVESAEMVRRAESVLLEHGAHDDLAIWCMMETPRGMLRAEEIADARSFVAQHGMVSFCRAMLNTNEFLFVF